MSFLMGKPAKLTSSTSNVNNPLITSTYGGQMNTGTAANSAESALLTGTGDTAGAQAGYNNYLQMAGYQPAMTELSRDITGQGAASGLLNSGSTAEALQSRGAMLNNQFYNNYLQHLSGLSDQGLKAGGLVTQAGDTSQSTSTGATQGLLGPIASVAGAALGGPLGAKIFSSDRRLKRDIELVGREPDGLGIYLCRYVWSRTRRLMVMADEVAKIRPWALGPTRMGFATVDYGAL